MKVLLINGSPHSKGSTYTALHEMEKIFAENGIETEMIHAGGQNIRGCIACGSCKRTGKCCALIFRSHICVCLCNTVVIEPENLRTRGHTRAA